MSYLLANLCLYVGLSLYAYEYGSEVSVCMCEEMLLFVHKHMYVCKCVHTFVCLQIYTCVWVDAAERCMCLCVCMCVCKCVYLCSLKSIHVCMCA